MSTRPNDDLIESFKNVFSAKPDAVAIIADLRGEEFLDNLYLASAIAFLSLFFLMISYSILAGFWITSFKSRVWRKDFRNNASDDIRALVIFPLILIIWPTVLPYELMTDHFIGVHDEHIYVRNVFLSIILIGQIVYPLFFWKWVAVTVRAFLRLRNKH